MQQSWQLKMLYPKAWYEMRLSGYWTYEVLIIPLVVTEILVVTIFTAKI